MKHIDGPHEIYHHHHHQVNKRTQIHTIITQFVTFILIITSKSDQKATLRFNR